MKRHCAVLTLCLLVCVIHAQNWNQVGWRLPFGVQALYADSVTDRLLIGGNFSHAYTSPTDSTLVAGLATWDGSRFDSLVSRIQTLSSLDVGWVSPINSIMRFKGDLYVGGGFGLILPDSTIIGEIVRLRPGYTQWEGLPCLYDAVAQLTSVVDSALFITGYFSRPCGFDSTCVIQWDSSAITPFQPFDALANDPNQYVGYVFRFQDQFYMTGLLVTDPVANEYHGLLRYNGISWEPVPGFDVSAPFKKFLIWQDRLYLAGYFREETGAPGNNIVSFDGTTWDRMDGGLLRNLQFPSTDSPIVMDMAIWHDQLVVCGYFSYAGDIEASNVALWDGSNWCSFGSNFDEIVSRMAVYHDSLFVSGAFDLVDGQPIERLAQWSGEEPSICSALGLDNAAKAHMQPIVYPNPCTDLLHVNQALLGICHVTDLTGRLVHVALPIQEHSIDVSSLLPGCYTLRSANGTTVRFQKK